MILENTLNKLTCLNFSYYDYDYDSVDYDDHYYYYYCYGQFWRWLLLLLLTFSEYPFHVLEEFSSISLQNEYDPCSNLTCNLLLFLLMPNLFIAGQTNADWYPHCLEELLDLPCILIYTGKDRTGQTFPRY